MLLQSLQSESGSRAAAERALECMRELFPICRSITGDGVRRSLRRLAQILPLEMHEVPSGTPVYDWEVPLEWNLREAYIADSNGHRVVDFAANSLHVVSYSRPLRQRLSLEELQPNLHSLPERPDWIPYRTSYYKEAWGFCVRHNDRLKLKPGEYEVVIDSDLSAGHLTYAQCSVAGSGPGHGLLYTHTCHPSLANDNLTGMCALAVVGAALQSEAPRLNWHLVFGPGTIGSLAWLSRNEAMLPLVEAGLTVGLLGDDAPLTYKRSRRGDTAIDRAAPYALRRAGFDHRVVDFEPYGYDERQFCSPGFDLPVGRLSRSSHGGYPQYHTSADDLSLVRVERLAESIAALARVVAMADLNLPLTNLSPKGEPRLGRRGLYGSVGGKSPADHERAMLWLLSLGDGEHDLMDAIDRSGLDLECVHHAAQELVRVGLLDRGLTKPQKKIQ